MVKVAARDIPRQLKSLEAVYRAVLVYGPNEGLVRERADLIARQVVADLADPFNAARLTGATVAADPPVLGDEAAAITMMGGRRVILIDGASDAVAAPLQDFLAAPKGDGLIVLIAGDLPARSALRQVAEAAAGALALPCYDDDAQSIEALARGLSEAEGLRFDADALRLLTGSVGADRMVARGEIDKLLLYKANDAARRITVEDIRAAIGDSADLTLDAVAEAVTGGDLKRLEDVLSRAFLQGEAAVSILRAIGRRLLRLYEAADAVASGSRPEDAVKRLRPPVFFKDVPAFVAQLNRWTPDTLISALKLVIDAEIQAKTTGLPADTICARTALRIANAARVGRG